MCIRDSHGVNWKRTLKGVLLMFTGGDIQGGSTITQQLIKNATQYDDVTVKRKILEIFTALDFDKTYSKEQILEWYLNYIYLGEGCYGAVSYTHLSRPCSSSLSKNRRTEQRSARLSHDVSYSPRYLTPAPWVASMFSVRPSSQVFSFSLVSAFLPVSFQTGSSQPSR